MTQLRAAGDTPAIAHPRFAGYPFSLGVASGSPLPTGVVLWTRLAPEPLAGGGLGSEAIVVRWEVADDEAFARVVQQGAVEALASRAHSVHVEVEGLAPERAYFYRFMAGSEVSAVGRTRTAPAADSVPARLRFAFASCQHFEQGFYAAHRHLAAEELDLMVFLGDYIYEGPGRTDQVPGRPPAVRRHAGGEARTLPDYRNRHAQYKTDPDLQRLHAALPWVLTWDDHEVDNNYAGMRSESLDPNFRRRRAAAYQAYFEHMPLRERARPTASGMILRSRHDFGRLARFHLLDGRQRRTPQACPRRGRGGSNWIGEDCRALRAPRRTMLGPAQERWLADGLGGVADRWNFIGEPTLVARALVRVDGQLKFSSDAWDGYPAARDRLLASITDAGVRSCVVLSGDTHTSFVCDLKRDFDDVGAPAEATELCGTSITTRGRAQTVTDQIVRDNAHIHYGDSARRGYVVVDVSAERCTASFRVLGDPLDRQSGIATAAAFAIEAGRPGAVPVSPAAV